MSGLTRLQLRSACGTHLGGLARLTALQHLASFCQADRRHSSRATHTDLAMLLGAGSSSLTHLALGPHSLTQPLVNCLAEMHSDEWQTGLALRGSHHTPTQQQGGAGASAAGAAAAAAVGSVRGGGGGSSTTARTPGAISSAIITQELAAQFVVVGDGVLVFDPQAAAVPNHHQLLLPPPPPLMSLRLVLSPHMRSGR